MVIRFYNGKQDASDEETEYVAQHLEDGEGRIAGGHASSMDMARLRMV